MKSQRLAWLLPALMATAALAALGEGPAAPDAAPVPAATGAPRVRPLATRLPGDTTVSDPFNPAEPSLTPARQQEVSSPVTPPPKPAAVPLPYRVIGKQFDDTRWTVFLASGETTLIVREGDLLDAAYQVASIQPPALVLRHLASGTRRTIDIGNAQE